VVNFCVISAKNFAKIKQNFWCNLIENPSVIFFTMPKIVKNVSLSISATAALCPQE